MRVFITGVAGFLGSHLADRMLAEGHTVIGVDNLTTGQERNVPGEMLFIDTSVEALTDLAKADLVIHCAASYKDPDDWPSDIETNVYGTANIARLARDDRIPVFYPQTVLPPITSYAISKIAGEQYLRLSGVPLTTFRLANVYGPRSVSGPIPAMYKRISQDQSCVAVRHVTRGFTYVDDVVEYIASKTAEARKWEYVVHDLGAPEETPITDLPWMIGKILDKRPTVMLRDPPDDDVDNYDMHVGPWGAKVALEDGIARTVAWYEEHGLEESYTHLSLAR